MNASTIYGTDSGPKHHCGSTIYRYDAKAFTFIDGENRTVYTVFATCIGCLRNAGMFELSTLPETAEDMRKCHQVVGAK